ncbi:uncharacterized protein METZ01_LOCUS253452, partial [marine metagenome]
MLAPLVLNVYKQINLLMGGKTQYGDVKDISAISKKYKQYILYLKDKLF